MSKFTTEEIRLMVEEEARNIRSRVTDRAIELFPDCQRSAYLFACRAINLTFANFFISKHFIVEKQLNEEEQNIESQRGEGRG
ncbi:MAG: hypothetical protein IPI97_14505 [Nitrosomonas sp.]|nr:hypothetical protein [Nitrosomonas sp.]